MVRAVRVARVDRGRQRAHGRALSTLLHSCEPLGRVADLDAGGIEDRDGQIRAPSHLLGRNGVGDELVGSRAVIGVEGNSRGQDDGHPAGTELPLDSCLHAFNERDRILAAHSRQYHGEIIAARSTGSGVLGALLGQHARHANEHLVAERMASDGVEPLEIVDVSAHERDLSAVGCSVGNLIGQMLVQVSVVEQPGHRVGDSHRPVNRPLDTAQP